MNKLKFFYYSLPIVIIKFINFFTYNFYNPVIEDFIFSSAGKKYGLNQKDKLNILKKFINIIKNVDSATSLETHVMLAKYLLNIPKSKKNYVVECGSFKGASSCSLSLICKLIGKKLIIYDSFEGLPSASRNNKTYYHHLKITENYKKGMYRGSLETVKKNISLYGEITQCIFRKGFFNSTLPKHQEKIDFLFLDVDLVSSTRQSIQFLWKKITDGSYIFTDDSCDMNNVRIWFDDIWWKKNFSIMSPGYIGSGCGLPIHKTHSGLGYTIKKPDLKKYNKANKFKN